MIEVIYGYGLTNVMDVVGALIVIALIDLLATDWRKN